jgi:uncharacterized protein (UPF0303 family)
MTPNTFKFAPAYQIGAVVWHCADRDSSGCVEAIVLYGREEFTYRVSWGSHECTEERETSITDERPNEFGAGESGDN